MYSEKLSQARSERDPVTGWLEVQSCDGMVWAGKYASSSGVDDVDIEAAEYPGEPGRFSRRPSACWTKDQGDVGSKTTWSRDMGVAGLFPYGFFKAKRDLLERHAAYGEAHHWDMGEPVADGRGFYTPQMIGLLYKAIEALGGPHNAQSLWPSIYPAGLQDYELHLQVADIHLHGEIAEVLRDPDNRPKSGAALAVSDTMFQRLQDAHEAEPDDPYFASVFGIYTGDMGPALTLLLDPAMPMGGYVRCEMGEQCRLAAWIYSASIVLSKFP